MYDGRSEKVRQLIKEIFNSFVMREVPKKKRSDPAVSHDQYN